MQKSEEFESGQMGLKTVKWAYSGVYLSKWLDALRGSSPARVLR